MKKWWDTHLSKWKERGYLHLAFLLLAELTTIGFVFFAGLFTLEMLLPTFVSARLSLTGILLVLLILLVTLFFLAQEIGLLFSSIRFSPRWWFTLLFLWSVTLTLIGLFKFSWWAIVIVALLGGALYFLIRFLFVDVADQSRPKD